MRKTIELHTSSKHQDHATPSSIFDPLHKLFAFTVDVCATEKTAKVPRFYSPEDNGLDHSWVGERYWMNPPYDSLQLWMAKSRHEIMEGTRQGKPTLGLHLLPMRPDGWWQKHVLAPAGGLRGSWYCPHSEVFWLAWERLTVGIHYARQRIAFERETNEGNGAPFPSVFVLFATPSERPRPRARPKWTDGGLAPMDWGMP